MGFDKLLIDKKIGVGRDINFRRYKIKISKQTFNNYLIKYFSFIEDYKGRLYFQIEVDDQDKSELLLILRAYYCLYLEVYKYTFKIHTTFPNKFIVKKNIKFKNHSSGKQGFLVGKTLYTVNNNYNTCDRLKGIPLWDSLDAIEGTELTPSIQINYEYIDPVCIA